MGNRPEMRSIEVGLAKPYVSSGAQVLELGGGNGYQASLMASWGAHVTSIDVAERDLEEQQFFPVTDYDGHTVPAPDNSFDVVFSSNVLEHLEDLDGLLREAARVTKPGGIGIHLMPTPTWRVWTSLSHYLYGADRLRRILKRSEKGAGVQGGGSPQFHKNVLFAGPHGEYSSAIAEVWYFSRFRWTRVFQSLGYELCATEPNRLFYTGYGVWPRLPLSLRRRLSFVLGSSCRLFVVRPPKRR